MSRWRASAGLSEAHLAFPNHGALFPDGAKRRVPPGQTQRLLPDGAQRRAGIYGATTSLVLGYRRSRIALPRFREKYAFCGKGKRGLAPSGRVGANRVPPVPRPNALFPARRAAPYSSRPNPTTSPGRRKAPSRDLRSDRRARSWPSSIPDSAVALPGEMRLCGEGRAARRHPRLWAQAVRPLFRVQTHFSRTAQSAVFLPAKPNDFSRTAQSAELLPAKPNDFSRTARSAEPGSTVPPLRSPLAIVGPG